MYRTAPQFAAALVGRRYAEAPARHRRGNAGASPRPPC